MVLCAILLGFLIKNAEMFSNNMDSGVDAFIKEYLPKDHQPAIADNTVHIAADLYNIISVDEVSETITTKLWLYLSYLVFVPEAAWDENLPWVYRFFPGINRIWKPDIIVLNNVEAISVSGTEPYVLRYYCDCEDDKCSYCGALVIFPMAITEQTTCGFDVTSFPFDAQECKILIGPWVTDFTSFPRYFDHLGQERGPYRISIANEGRRMSLKSYEANSQWELLGVTIENKTRTAKTSIEVEYDYLEYTLRMKRKPHFYVYTIILPCLCLTLLAVLSIYIPVESGEKLGLGVTLLLAQVVNLLILSSILPASSQFFPHLGFYFLSTIIIISVTLLYNAVIINIYYHGYSDVFNFFKKKLNRKRPTETKIYPDASVQEQVFGNDAGGAKEKQNKGMQEVLSKMEEKALKMEEKSSDSDEAELRMKRCRVADHIFAVIIFICVLGLHIIYFSPYM